MSTIALDGMTLASFIRSVADAVRADKALAPDYQSPDRAGMQDMAKDLLSVGDRRGRDDYDKRLTALASDVLPDLGVEDRGRLIGALLENDKGATRSDSWLQGSRLDKLVDEGGITGAQRQQVLEAFGTAYTAGEADMENTWRFMEMDGVSGEVVDKASPRQTSLGISRIENNNTSGEVLERFLNGLGDGDSRSSGFADFIETFAIDQLQAGEVGSTKTGSNDRADYLGVLLNAADHAGKDGEVVNNILHGVDSEKRTQAIQDVSAGFSKVTTENAWLDREDSKLPDSYNKDPMEILIRAVANDPASVYARDTRSHAADMAELILDESKNDPWGDNGFFDDQNIPKAGRQDAVNELMIKKASEIFEFNGFGETGIHEGSNVSHVERNVQTMANLTRLTGLSPTNEAAPEVLGSLAKLADSWAQDYMSAREAGNTDRMYIFEHRLTHAVASTGQAVLNGFSDKAEDDAARQADMMNMLNFFVGLVPSPGGVLTGNLKTGFTQVFGESSSANRIFDSAAGAVGGVIDDSTVGAFKDRMVELMSKSDYQDQYLATFRDNANTFIESQLLRGLDGEGTAGIRAQIVKEASQLLTA